MNVEDLAFEPLDRAGVATLVAWAAKEGWNPGVHDVDLFYETDPNGFFGYFLDDELIGGGSLVSYGGAFGFMGLFIVKPEFRSQGIGRQLWLHRRDHLLSRLKEGASIGMDGVVDMQPFYNKGGFEIAFRDERYEAVGRSFSISPFVSSMREADFPEVSGLDLECFGFARPDFLRAWLAQPDARSFVYRNASGFQGFTLMRKTQVGYKIGPLFAASLEVAKDLYEACLDSARGEPVYLDIPVSNPDAISLVREYGAEYVFECARMYYGSPPDVPIQKIFGITTFELG